MPKTAVTKPRNVKNLVILSPGELKTLINLLESLAEVYHSGGYEEPEQRRYLAKLERIKAKLRRGV